MTETVKATKVLEEMASLAGFLKGTLSIIESAYLAGSLAKQLKQCSPVEFEELVWSTEDALILVCHLEGHASATSITANGVPDVFGHWDQLVVHQCETYEEVISNGLNSPGTARVVKNKWNDANLQIVLIPQGCQLDFWYRYRNWVGVLDYECSNKASHFAKLDQFAGRFNAGALGSPPWFQPNKQMVKLDDASRVAKLLGALPGVEGVFLFGSASRRDVTVNDIDMGILMPAESTWPQEVVDEAFENDRWMHNDDDGIYSKRCWDEILESFGIGEDVIHEIRVALGLTGMDLIVMYSQPEEYFLQQFEWYNTMDGFLDSVTPDYKVYQADTQTFVSKPAPWVGVR